MQMYDTVDGSEIPNNEFLNPCKEWDKLPFPQLVSLSDFWNINSTFGRIDGFTSGAKYPSTQRQGAEFICSYF